MSQGIPYPLGTVEQRRAALKGWVYSPYRMTDLIRGALRGWESRLREKDIGFQVFDGDTLSEETLLFDSIRPGSAPRDGDAYFTQTKTVSFAGRLWTLRFTQVGGLQATANYGSAWFAFAGGMTAYWFSG